MTDQNFKPGDKVVRCRHAAFSKWSFVIDFEDEVAKVHKNGNVVLKSKESAKYRKDGTEVGGNSFIQYLFHATDEIVEKGREHKRQRQAQKYLAQIGEKLTHRHDDPLKLLNMIPRELLEELGLVGKKDGEKT